MHLQYICSILMGFDIGVTILGYRVACVGLVTFDDFGCFGDYHFLVGADLVGSGDFRKRKSDRSFLFLFWVLGYVGERKGVGGFPFG